MKTILKSTLFITIISVLFFSSCKKYEDGPAISLRSKKSRIAGDWTIGSATYNGNDQTAQYQAIISSFKIEKGGSYTITGSVGTFPYTDSGTWKFGEDKDDIAFTSNTAGVPATSYHILRLKHKDVWLQETKTNGDILEIKLK